MSKMTGALAFIQKLKERARKGDGNAINELRKLRAIGSQYKQMAEAMAANAAADEVVEGAEEEEVGAAEQIEDDIIAGDKLEQADFVAQKYANADNLMQKVALRNQGWKGFNDVAKFARINPPSVMQGTLGGQQVVRSDDVKPIQVANWGGEDEETLPITVTLAPVEQIPIDGTASFNAGARPFAYVQWGTRAMLVAAYVDIGRGCQFTINASYCTVSVGVEIPIFVGSPGVISMKLAGMLSFYPCVRTAPMTRTLSMRVAAGQVVTFSVPPFAKNVTPLPVEHTPFVPYTVVFYDSAGNVVYNREVTGSVLQPIPISNTINQVVIDNSAGADTQNGDLVFELAL